uniref:Macaca fascicularis brain cDNA clone: QtrA-15657, similar to human similar to Retrovirus-related Pol polyprotein fromtransposon 297 (LOC400754), mRNA, RefSeq: XM_375732.1 n=1 Tax=Macaca fascicularis TaxID=9541 RepID=I7GPE7_MACFA|nr:unnamed protein product [Macaca fascicularis]
MERKKEVKVEERRTDLLTYVKFFLYKNHQCSLKTLVCLIFPKFVLPTKVILITGRQRR